MQARSPVLCKPAGSLSKAASAGGFVTAQWRLHGPSGFSQPWQERGDGAEGDGLIPWGLLQPLRTPQHLGPPQLGHPPQILRHGPAQTPLGTSFQPRTDKVSPTRWDCVLGQEPGPRQPWPHR